MNLNRDASAMRLSSHTGLRPTRRPTQPTVDGEVVVNMLRSRAFVVAAVLLRRWMVNTLPQVAHDASHVVAYHTGLVRSSQRHRRRGEPQ